MKNTELGELFLYKLLEISESKGYGTLTSLQELAKKEFLENDSDKIYNISKYLEDLGLIDAVYTSSGEALASISGSGAILVEGGGKTGIIDKFKNNQIQFIMEQKNINLSGIKNSNISVESQNVHQSIEQKTNDIDSIFNQMFEILKNDKTLDENVRHDAEADLEILKAHLKKSTKDKNIINKIIEGIGKLAPLAPLVPQLISAVSGLL